MKKILVGVISVILILSAILGFAIPMYKQINDRNTVYAASKTLSIEQEKTSSIQSEADIVSPAVIDDTASQVEQYIAVQESRKSYLKDMYDKGLITKNRYDLSIAVIQEDIDFVEKNGLSTLYNSNSGPGYGGCCGW